MKSKGLVLLLLLAVLIISGCGNQQKAASYPAKPIEVIIPYGAGGATDLVGRTLEKVMKKYMPGGQAIIIVNKPGGAGVVGTTEVAKAKPDGYKIGLVPAGTVSVQPNFGNAPYTPADFQGVIRLATSPVLFAVKADAPWKTFDEWVNYVQKNPDTFVYGSAGTGNPAQLAMEKFLKAKGLNAKFVPYDSSGQAYTALLGGHLHGETSTSQEIKGQLDSQNVRVLANMGMVKDEFYKDVPSLKELGYDMSTEVYFGIIAPKETPKDVLRILHDAFKQAMEDPEVEEIFRKLGIKSDYAGQEAFTRQLQDDYNSYRTTLKEIGLIN